MKQLLLLIFAISILTVVVKGESGPTAVSRVLATIQPTEPALPDAIRKALPFETVDPIQFQPKFKKGKAILLGLFLGHFGAHRIYLGTDMKVPVIYSLTLGGGFGLLAFADIIAILSSKDLSRFENNSNIIMWLD